MRKLAGLFINCVEAQDSIFESGKMAYECLLGSGQFSLDYQALTPENTAIPTKYDFYLFNYHLVTMSYLDVVAIRKSLPGVKITLVLEVAPNNPFVYCSPEDFDAYCVLDPTLKATAENVFVFPRPLEPPLENNAYQAGEIPVIGSFGFATQGKGFEHVVDAVNREFERALIRINIPFATYADESHNYARQLAEMCQQRAKPGVQVVVTHDYMSKRELIKWCQQNTLNCFLYDRNMPGLAATTDQAVASGRPLIVSKNNTFRHIQSYIKPFPYQSLQEAIANTETAVQQMQQDWSAENFRQRFEQVLATFTFAEKVSDGGTVALKSLPATPSVLRKIKTRLNVRKNLGRLKNAPLVIKSLLKGPAQPSNSYSQFGEDLIINKLFTEIPLKTISYLDIGANNPKYISNTYFFYERGFTGVLVEPNARLCQRLKQVRPRDQVLNVGVGLAENVTEADFYLFPAEADGLSTFSLQEAKHWEEVGLNGRKYKVEAVLKMPLISLNHIIERYFTECPDFVSLDVEGWDLKILQTFDFAKYSPAVFCVETLAYREDGTTYRVTELNDLFASKGYFSFAQTTANDIFVNQKLYDFHCYQKSVAPSQPA